MNKNNKWYVIGAVVIVGLFALSFYYAQKPQRLDAFAQCLGEQGVTFYGAFWCPHCQEQKALFGGSQKKLPYKECSTADGRNQLEECTQAGIESYPTWEFSDGSRENRVMTPEQLAEKSGCELPA